jgi:hypothetical protein
VGDGDGVDVGEAEVGGGEGFFHNGQDVLDMSPAGDFRDDAAISGVEIGLGGDDVAGDDGAVNDDGGGGFVAGGFDAEDGGHEGI